MRAVDVVQLADGEHGFVDGVAPDFGKEIAQVSVKIVCVAVNSRGCILFQVDHTTSPRLMLRGSQVVAAWMGATSYKGHTRSS